MKLDKKLLSGLIVDAIAIALSLLFNWMQIDVPLEGLEDHLLTIRELLFIGGTFLVGWSMKDQIEAVRVQNGKMLKDIEQIQRRNSL